MAKKAKPVSLTERKQQISALAKEIEKLSIRLDILRAKKLALVMGVREQRKKNGERFRLPAEFFHQQIPLQAPETIEIESILPKNDVAIIGDNWMRVRKNLLKVLFNDNIANVAQLLCCGGLNHLRRSRGFGPRSKTEKMLIASMNYQGLRFP